MRFENKIFVITGCGGEMATEMCRQILKEKGIVVGIDCQPALLENSKKLFQQDGFTNFHGMPADISNRKEIEAACEQILEKFGSVDVLINHAGSTSSESLEQTSAEKWEKDVQVNLNGTFYITNKVLESMKLKQSGNIVTISSVNADRTYGNPAYSAAKAALISFSKSIAVEYGCFNIRSNIVSPGSVRTKGWDKRIENNPKIFENIIKWYPLKKLATPKSVSNAVLFLASDDANCISGINLRVDAGLSAGCALFARDITSQNFGI